MVEKVSEYSQSYTATVAGSVEDCFAVLVDFPSYPEWSSPITECRVLERYPDGLARRVAFALDMMIRTVRYTLEYTYDPPRGARWRLVEGDITNVEGSYRFVPAGDGTEATCSQSVDLGFRFGTVRLLPFCYHSFYRMARGSSGYALRIRS